MVDEKQQTRQAIQKLITYVCGLPWFDRKKEVVDALYTIEWSLRTPEEKKATVDFPDTKNADTEVTDYEPHWE